MSGSDFGDSGSDDDKSTKRNTKRATNESPPISGWNFANFFFYIASYSAIFCFFYVPDLRETLRKSIIDDNFTVLTPHFDVFLFWFVVMIAQGIFVVFQFMPAFRGSEQVQAVTPFFGVCCLLQGVWAFFLYREDNVMAFGWLVVATAVMLGALLTMDMRQPTLFEYWLIRAPFSLNGGWLLGLTVMNINMQAASSGAFQAPGVLAVSVISLVVMFLLTALFSVASRRPDPIFPIGVFWMCMMIFRQSRVDSHILNFAKDPRWVGLAGVAQEGMGYAAIQVAMGCLWIVALSAILRIKVCTDNANLQQQRKRQEQARASVMV